MEERIKISGARAGGLRDVDLELALGKVLCFTGRSSNGRLAMAVDVLYAESRRRYMQALSPVEREGIGGVGKVDLDEITGLPPAIYLGRKRRGRSVGDYLQLDAMLIQLVMENGQMHCADCGGACRGYEAAEVESELVKLHPGKRWLIMAPLQVREGIDWGGFCRELTLGGFLRVMIAGEVIRLDGEVPAPPKADDDAYVVIDRLVPTPDSNVRFLEAVRLSRSISSGQTTVWEVESEAMLDFNQQPTCCDCGRQYEELIAHNHASGDANMQNMYMFGRSFTDLAEEKIADVQILLDANVPEGNLRAKINAILLEAGNLQLDHLALNRRVETLSGGEWLRLQLAACLTSGLMGILYIFEEMGGQVGTDLLPAVVGRLRHLVQLGNTVLLLDHHHDLVADADQVWDFTDGRARLVTSAPAVPKVKRRSAKIENYEFLTIVGMGPLGELSIELPQGALTCLHGPSGCGKTRILHDLLPAALKGKATGYAVSGVGRNNRVVTLDDRVGRDTLLAEMGVFERIAGLYAASAVAKAQGWGRAAFMLDKPGGRCPSCEGLGQRHFDLEFLEDISLKCEACEGLRFRSEIREITLRGISISDVLALTVERGLRHFARDAKIKASLEAADRCGLGYLSLGQNVRKLERGEWLRLRLALESTRKSNRSWLLIDEPAGGDHPQDVQQMVMALQLLLEKGATIVVAERHPLILAAADKVVELQP